MKQAPGDLSFSSIDALKADLLSTVGTMQHGESRLYKAFVTSSSDSHMEANRRYIGYLCVDYKINTALEFAWNAVNANGDDLRIGYSNGIWNITSANKTIKVNSIANVEFQYGGGSWVQRIIFDLNGVHKSMLEVTMTSISYSITDDGGASWTTLWTK